MSIVVPPKLERGQLIGIVAPAGPVKPERLQRGLDRLRGTFRIRVAPSLVALKRGDIPSYLAASDDQRAAELQAMIGDPDVRAIVLARGGYGLMRILPALDPEPLRRDPKPIVGFSDATALLAWAYRAGVRGIHGPVIAQLGDLADRDVEQLVTMLTDARPAGERPWSLAVRHGSGRITAPLVPANLTMASMLVGTKWPVPLAGSIALLEEVGEKPYEIDRYMTQLMLTGVLGETRAVVVGDLTRCHDPRPPSGEPDPDDAAQRTVCERVIAAGKPCAFGAPVGHGSRNESLPFAAACELDLDRGMLAILEAAVQ
ncbi:MAG TPA: LD-carboxypeptidase [Kofleriaceae bacterium]|nr:LD-carboxypeptidase [Kofleriaceae bacterium]